MALADGRNEVRRCSLIQGRTKALRLDAAICRAAGSVKTADCRLQIAGPRQMQSDKGRRDEQNADSSPLDAPETWVMLLLMLRMLLMLLLLMLLMLSDRRRAGLSSKSTHKQPYRRTASRSLNCAVRTTNAQCPSAYWYLPLCLSASLLHGPPGPDSVRCDDTARSRLNSACSLLDKEMSECFRFTSRLRDKACTRFHLSLVAPAARTQSAAWT